MQRSDVISVKTFLLIKEQKDKDGYTFWKGALGEGWLLPCCEWTKREDKLIVIDNADVLLNDETRKYM